MQEVYNAIEYAKSIQFNQNPKFDPDGPPITIDALVQAYRDAHQSLSPSATSPVAAQTPLKLKVKKSKRI
jgi:hypothetical protein